MTPGDDRVPGHEGLTVQRHVPEVPARGVAVADARARALPVDELLDDLVLEEELHRDDEHEAEREPPLAVDRGTDRDEERDEQQPGELEHIHDRAQEVRQPVDDVEHVLLELRDLAGTDDQDAHDEDRERGRRT